MRQALRHAPSTPIALGGVAVLAWFAVQDGGYDVRTWAPGGLLLLALLVVGLFALPAAWRTVPRSTVLAAGLLAAYCAWSYASVLWAADPGAAWSGASRTAVFLVAFALFAAWRQQPATGGALLGMWAAAVAVLAGILAVSLGTTDDPRTLLPEGRLLDPTGYANATAGLLMMACFAAFVPAAARSTPWALRGLAAGAAVLMADVALLAVSRGSLLATPICLLLLLGLFDGRLRRLATLMPIAGGVALAAPRIIEVTDVLGRYRPPRALDEAAAASTAILVGAGLAAVVVGLAALLEARRPITAAAARRAHRAGSVVAAVAGVAAVIATLLVVGNPVTRLENGWTSFKGGYTEYSGNRLGSGLGSNRYDFYRVALDVFRDDPVAGAGVDNYYERYLRDGRSSETPRYPHSLELRTLSETGIVGALLLFGALAAMLPAVLRAGRGRGASDGGRAVATGATLAATYWVVHGSADWFFEYAGLATAAFALLGLACALDPARGVPDRAVAGPWSPRRRVGVPAGVAVVALVPALALGGLWLADREVTRAGEVFATRSGEAYDRLDRARRLEPLSDTPDSVAGSIAVRLNDPRRALDLFDRALDRSPDDAYVQLLIGAVQSALDHDADARRSLDRAVVLAPRDQLAREARAVVRSGGSIDLAALSARVLARARPGG